jgi:hypothetical protein
MAPVKFDLTNPIEYVRSFEKLASALGQRKRGDVVEIEAAIGDGSVRLFMEADGLYIIGFRGEGGKPFVLNGENQDFSGYIKEFLKANKETGGLTELPTVARYDQQTWKLTFSKSELLNARELELYDGDGSVKRHIDLLAFAIAESLRFKPIRCAVACELRGDEFKFVLFKLAEWSGKFYLDKEERNVGQPPKKPDDPPLSPADARLRERLGSKSIHVVPVHSNTFSKFSIIDRMLEILGGSSELRHEDRQRLKSYQNTWRNFTLGDFRSLMTNWRTLSLIDDPNVRGIMGVLHNEVRQITSSSAINVVEFH